MNREDYLELSNSKSQVGSQSTALNSVTKIGSVDKLLEDQDSWTFSDILRADLFKTPQKSRHDIFPLPKGSPPTKSEVKEDYKEYLGKKSDFHIKYLDSHLDQYMSSLRVKKCKKMESPLFSSELNHREMNDFEHVPSEENTLNELPFLSKPPFLLSTKYEVSREKSAKDMDFNPLIDHKRLFERIGTNISCLKDNDPKHERRQQLNHLKFNQIFDDDHNLEVRPVGVAHIIKLCKNITTEALDIIPSIKEERERLINLNVPIVELNEPKLKNDSSSSDDLMASSETLSLKNFPSSSRKGSAVMQHPEDLPKPLFLLYTKFSRLDFLVYESLKMERVSLWENHVSNIQKFSEL